MANYEFITPIIAPTPQGPPVSVFDGAVMLRCGTKGGATYNNLQLPANPDQNIETDFRVTMTQTLTGVYFDNYGIGVPTLTLSGNTAWLSPKGLYNGSRINGYDAAKHLNNDIIKYFFSIQNDNANPQNAELLIFDYTKNASWSVQPIDKMRVYQTKDDPMVIYYTLTFKIIKDLVNDPASPDFKPNDPVQTLVVGTTNASVSSSNYESQNATQTQSTPSVVADVVSSAQSVSQTPNRTYTVVSGDTLWGIAEKYYGNSFLYTLIYNANKQYIKNPNLIFPGQTFVIPPGPNSNAA